MPQTLRGLKQSYARDKEDSIDETKVHLVSNSIPLNTGPISRLRPRSRRGRDSTRRRLVSLALVGVFVAVGGTVAAVSPSADFDYDFTIHTRVCSDSLTLLADHSVADPDPDINVTYTVELTGDAQAHSPTVTFETTSGTVFTGPRFPRLMTNVDWVNLGANPRLEVTSEYQVGSDSPTTGQSFTIPIVVPEPSAMTLNRGSGTAADPFLIGSPDEVWNIGCYLGVPHRYLFDADVDLSQFSTFVPIGTGDEPFVGMIDGAGHTISHLTIEVASSSGIGFIGAGGYTDLSSPGVVIRDLVFDQATVVGDSRVGIVAAQFFTNALISGVEVRSATLQGRRELGLIAGEMLRSTLVNLAVDGQVTSQQFGDLPISNVGGLVGLARESHIEGVDIDIAVSATQRADSNAELSTVAGLIGGIAANPILVSGVRGSVAVEIETKTTRTDNSASAGLIGGRGLYEISQISDSDVAVDLSVTAPATSDLVSFQQIGGVVSYPQFGSILNSRFTGSVTIDVRNATGAVVINRIGGVVGSNDGCRHISIVGVDSSIDVTVLGDARDSAGDTVPVSRVAGLHATPVCQIQVTDTVVSGAVTVEGEATQVGGAFGLFAGEGGSSASSLIYRGDGVSVGEDSDADTVGVVVGAFDSDGTPDDALFSNVWWDSTTTGVVAVDANPPARPATSAQLGSESWLAEQGFNMNRWCVSDGVPSLRVLTPECAPSVPGAPGQPSAVVSGSSVEVAWSAPTVTGGSPITGYEVTALPGGEVCVTSGAQSCSFDDLAAGTYVFVVQAENSSGLGERSLPSDPVTVGGTPPGPGPGDGFVEVEPSRVLDTRGAGPVAAGSVTRVALGGDAPEGATGVVLNVTVVEALAAGYVSVYPCDEARPVVSNVNYATGATVPNSVIVGLDADAAVCVYTDRSLNLLVDVMGWFTAGFTPTVPTRAFDTRDGQSRGLRTGEMVSTQIAGVGGVPLDATGVVLNLTAVEPDAAGYVTVYDCGQRPGTSSVNFGVGGAVANLVITPLSGDGQLCLYSSAPTGFVVDVFGWFASTFESIDPVRVLDTRPTGPFGASLVTRVQVAGVGGVPAEARAVAANVTAVEASAAGYASVYPCQATPPNASNLNFVTGGTVANGAFVGLDAGGGLCVFTSAASDYLVDIVGWFAD